MNYLMDERYAGDAIGRELAADSLSALMSRKSVPPEDPLTDDITRGSSSRLSTNGLSIFLHPTHLQFLLHGIFACQIEKKR